MFNLIIVYLLSLTTDVNTESRIEKPHPVYVPRDETFEEVKQNTFSIGRMKALLHNLVPSIAASLSNSDIAFKCFSDFDKLYNDGFTLQGEDNSGLLGGLIVSKILNKALTASEKLLKYEIPAVIQSMNASFLCLLPSVVYYKKALHL